MLKVGVARWVKSGALAYMVHSLIMHVSGIFFFWSFFFSISELKRYNTSNHTINIIEKEVVN